MGRRFDYTTLIPANFDMHWPSFKQYT